MLVKSLHSLETLSAKVAVDLHRDRVNPQDVSLQKLHSAERLSALRTGEAFRSAEVDRDRLDLIVVVVLVGVFVVVDLLLDLVRVHVHHDLLGTVGVR